MFQQPDPARMATRLEELWSIQRGPNGGADRPAYSAAEAAAMRLVGGWAQEAGLKPAIDPFGNLWAAPTDDPASVISSGSHVDTVPDGGRYDGALGTVLALEAATCLRDVAPVAILVCAAEEASRFGAGTIGSRLLVGTLELATLQRLTDRNGVTAASALSTYLAALSDQRRVEAVPLDRIRAHMEVHIEQKARLRAASRQLGVVTCVASPHRYEVVVHGEAGHAGEILMDERRDALAAAAELVLGLEALARDAADPTVATVGALAVEPGFVSVIPEEVTLQLEVRGIDEAVIVQVENRFEAIVEQVAARRRVTIDSRRVRGGTPAVLDARIVDAALEAAHERGIEVTTTHSGAGHDVQHLATAVPAGLLFVPLAAGESHTPAEAVDLNDAALAAEILISVLGRSALRRDSEVS